MIRYYCSGFDINNAFGHGLGAMFKAELKNTKSIVYIPGSYDKIEKAKKKYVPIFTEHFRNAGIEFELVHLLAPELESSQANDLCKNADLIMLMGGCPFQQKKLCEKLEIMDQLKNYNGIMLGLSAGAMLMSKHVIVTPCSEEYPDFRVEDGLNLDSISIFPHNNTTLLEYPDKLISGDETYKKSDLLTVSKQYGPFYLLQDNPKPNGTTDVSAIKSSNGKLEFYTENDGRIWLVDKDVHLVCGPKKSHHNNELLHFTGIKERE